METGYQMLQGRKKNRLLLIFWLFMLCLPNQNFAGPPFLTDDPEPVEYTHWELYLFSILDKNSQPDEEPDLLAPAIELNFGALPNLQIHLVVPYAWSLPSATSSENGMGDIEAGIKYRLIQESESVPQIGVFPLIELPNGNVDKNLGNGKAWFKLPIWIQKSWGTWTSYGGGGYAINPAENMRNYPYAGWLIQKNINDKLSLGAEIFTQGAVSINSSSYTVLNAGGQYNVTKHFSLLFSVGHSIIGETHKIAYAGLYFTGP